MKHNKGFTDQNLSDSVAFSCIALVAIVIVILLLVALFLPTVFVILLRIWIHCQLILKVLALFRRHSRVRIATKGIFEVGGEWVFPGYTCGDSGVDRNHLNVGLDSRNGAMREADRIPSGEMYHPWRLGFQQDHFRSWVIHFWIEVVGRFAAHRARLRWDEFSVQMSPQAAFNVTWLFGKPFPLILAPSIVSLGGKAGEDWIEDKIRSKFTLEGWCWGKSHIPEAVCNLVESVHADVDREGVKCTLLGGLKKGQAFDAQKMKTLERSQELANRERAGEKCKKQFDGGTALLDSGSGKVAMRAPPA
ncbi:hypothetical protein B0H13DRAFT_1912423 [Mycena leptocephala]|nr:hypothetical protein B0H13DRAFT_1912423 [Mycena leptocephala]